MRTREEFLLNLWREYLELAESMDKVNFYLPKSINSLKKFLDLYVLVIVGFKQYVNKESAEEEAFRKAKDKK